MTDGRLELTRRKILAGAGAVGLAGAGAGLGSSAFFSDRETFTNNRLVAGSLDMTVGWAEHYSDWSADEAEFAHMEDGELVVDDRQGFMDATLQEQFPDKRTRAALEEGTADPCEVLADVPDDLEKPVIHLEDVKPGDFGEVTFDFVLCDNPGYVWLNGGLVSESENGLTEPEAEDPDEGPGVELTDEIQVTIWYDSGNNVLEDPETIVTDREFDPPISSAVAVSGDDRIIAQGSLRNVLSRLATPPGIPLDGIPGSGSPERDCFTDSPTIHNIAVTWELPVDHANEVQTDAVEFDLGFYTEQCRHNDGVGLTTGLVGHYPLDTVEDGVAEDISGNGNDGAVDGDVTSVSGKIGSAASFDGAADDYIEIGDAPSLGTTTVTIAAWVFRDGATQRAYVVDGRDHKYFIKLDDGTNTPRFGVSTDGSFEILNANSGDIPDRTWTHVAGTYDGSDLTLYVNGTPDGTKSAAGDIDVSSGPARIGDYIGGGYEFDGRIDEVRIYDRALSDQEIQELSST